MTTATTPVVPPTATLSGPAKYTFVVEAFQTRKEHVKQEIEKEAAEEVKRIRDEKLWDAARKLERLLEANDEAGLELLKLAEKTIALFDHQGVRVEISYKGISISGDKRTLKNFDIHTDQRSDAFLDAVECAINPQGIYKGTDPSDLTDKIKEVLDRIANDLYARLTKGEFDSDIAKKLELEAQKPK